MVRRSRGVGGEGEMGCGGGGGEGRQTGDMPAHHAATFLSKQSPGQSGVTVTGVTFVFVKTIAVAQWI